MAHISVFLSFTIAMLICIQWRVDENLSIFTIVDYVANTEVATQQANAADCSPQYTATCLESSDCSRSSW